MGREREVTREQPDRNAESLLHRRGEPEMVEMSMGDDQTPYVVCGPSERVQAALHQVPRGRICSVDQGQSVVALDDVAVGVAVHHRVHALADVKHDHRLPHRHNDKREPILLPDRFGCQPSYSRGTRRLGEPSGHARRRTCCTVWSGRTTVLINPTQSGQTTRLRRPSASPRPTIPMARTRCRMSSAEFTGTKLAAVSWPTMIP